MNSYNFRVNLYEQMEVIVVAENEEEARRILNETIEGITVKEIRDKLSNCNEVKIENSNVVKNIQERQSKSKEVER